MREKEKMLAGQWYDANYDENLNKERNIAKDLCFELNQTKPSNKAKRQTILKALLHAEANNLELLSPFYVDYGYNLFLGEQVFINHDCYFMDGGKIFVGNHVFIGPKCGFYTAIHPLAYQDRNQGLEQALPINIGDNVWIGANVIVLPGVTIGNGSVIGAGSVVSKDIPENIVAVGSPAKPIKTIENNAST